MEAHPKPDPPASNPAGPGETRTIPQRELRNDISRILREVKGGATFEVTVDGHPVAKLSPIDTRQTFVPIEKYFEIMRRSPLPPEFLDELIAMRREMTIDIDRYAP